MCKVQRHPVMEARRSLLRTWRCFSPGERKEMFFKKNIIENVSINVSTPVLAVVLAETGMGCQARPGGWLQRNVALHPQQHGRAQVQAVAGALSEAREHLPPELGQQEQGDSQQRGII